MAGHKPLMQWWRSAQCHRRTHLKARRLGARGSIFEIGIKIRSTTFTAEANFLEGKGGEEMSLGFWIGWVDPSTLIVLGHHQPPSQC